MKTEVVKYDYATGSDTGKYACSNRRCFRFLNPFSATTAFSCGRAKTIQNRDVRTRIFWKKEKKIFVFKQKRIRVDGTHFKA